MATLTVSEILTSTVHFNTNCYGGAATPPGGSIPPHVHMHVIEPGGCTYFIDDILFEDDPRLTAEKRNQSSAGRGGAGLVMPAKDASGTWVVKRDIVLGEKIPGYPEGPQPPAAGDSAPRGR